MKILKCPIFVAAFLLIFSCAEEEMPTTLFGLPHVAIDMRESDFIDLRRNSLVNEYAAMTIETGGAKENGRIRRRGGISRFYPKPSFHVITDSGERHYVAANLDKSYCREVFSYLFFKRHGFLTPETKFVALSVNNVYQGLYISREPIDRNFFARRDIGINSLYQIRSGGRFTLQGNHNSAMDFEKIYPQSSMFYDDLNTLLSALDANSEEDIINLSNVENAAMYSFISSIINNADGITKNLHIYNRNDNGKFEIIPYDLDLTLSGIAFFPKFENGLLERAENIFTANTNRTREEYISDLASDIYFFAITSGVLDSLKNEISQAYDNDPYHRGEDLNAHVSELKLYLTEVFSVR